MNIQETIEQIDALREAANDLDDVFAVQAQATVKHKLFEHWPAISAELKRLQEELGMAIFQKNLLEESFNMAMAEVGQQQATIKKARETLEHFATIKPITASADQISRIVHMLARDALAALDGLVGDVEAKQPELKNPNCGHGHVRPRPDGVRARCGGPAICRVCQQELATLSAAPKGGE